MAPAGATTRPTSDFVREAVFNSLVSHLDVAESNVVDLFAGTGALGIEALSRGATVATFVERDRAALAAIDTNLDTLGFADRATIIRGDATLVDLPVVDLAFVDPPYAFQDWPTVLARVHAHIAVLESDREVDPGDRWRVLKVKRYGTTVVTLTSARSAR